MGAAGTDAALEMADVALMGDDPRKVAGLIGLARWTRATVRQNIVFALYTKLLAAVLLTLGRLPLWGAVVADVGASLLVVLWVCGCWSRRPAGRCGVCRRCRPRGARGAAPYSARRMCPTTTTTTTTAAAATTTTRTDERARRCRTVSGDALPLAQS